MKMQNVGLWRRLRRRNRRGSGGIAMDSSDEMRIVEIEKLPYICQECMKAMKRDLGKMECPYDFDRTFCGSGRHAL